MWIIIGSLYFEWEGPTDNYGQGPTDNCGSTEWSIIGTHSLYEWEGPTPIRWSGTHSLYEWEGSLL